MLQGFKDFISRGNVIDLAVAVVLGAAFTGIVNALVDGLITPLISAIFGKPSVGDVGTFTINGSIFSLGLIIDAVINFLIVAAAIYFIVIVPMNKMLALRKAKDEPVESPADDIRLLEEIRDLLKEQRPS